MTTLWDIHSIWSMFAHRNGRNNRPRCLFASRFCSGIVICRTENSFVVQLVLGRDVSFEFQLKNVCRRDLLFIKAVPTSLAITIWTLQVSSFCFFSDVMMYKHTDSDEFISFRYESAKNEKKRYDTDRRTCVHFVTFIAAVSLLTLVVSELNESWNEWENDNFYSQILIFASLRREHNVERIVLLSEIDAASRNGTNMSSHLQLTTVFYPDEQIGSFRNVDRFKYKTTTPMNNIVQHESATAVNGDNEYANHKKRFAEMFLPDERSAREDDIPIGFHMRNLSTSKVVFPAERVNNIQDILDQVQDESYDELIHPSAVPRGRSIRLAGTYRQYKPDALATMASMTMTNTHRFPASSAEHDGRKRARDPFARFKPRYMSDVNLLAPKHVRFAPYPQHTGPRPMLRAPPKENGFPPLEYTNQNTAESLYKKIIRANNYRAKPISKPTETRHEQPSRKHKPFSLMLDVYPMSNDDEIISSTNTMVTPYGHRLTPPPPPPRPIYPIPLDANAINHNLQHFANDNSYYNRIKFPQLQSYHHMPMDLLSAASQVNGPDLNYYMPHGNYMSKRPHVVYPTNQFHRPLPAVSSSDDTPSQITVHLNLFPNKKKAKSSSTSRIQNNSILDTAHLNNADDRFDNYFSTNNASPLTMTSPIRSHDVEMPFEPPTFTSTKWIMPRLDEATSGDEDGEGVTGTSTTTTTDFIPFDKFIAEDMSPLLLHTSKSIEFDATTNHNNNENRQSAHVANHSTVTASGRHRLFLPESTHQHQTNTFSKSSSAQSEADNENNNNITNHRKTTAASTLPSNAT